MERLNRKRDNSKSVITVSLQWGRKLYFTRFNCKIQRRTNRVYYCRRRRHDAADWHEMAIGQGYVCLFDAYSDAAAVAADAGAVRLSSFRAYCGRDAAKCVSH